MEEGMKYWLEEILGQIFLFPRNTQEEEKHYDN